MVDATMQNAGFKSEVTAFSFDFRRSKCPSQVSKMLKSLQPWMGAKVTPQITCAYFPCVCVCVPVRMHLQQSC